MADDQEKSAEESKGKDTPEEEVGKSKRKRLLILGGAGLLLVVGVGAGAAYFIGGFGSEQTDKVVVSSKNDFEQEGEFTQEADEIATESQNREQDKKQPQVTMTDFGETYQLKTFNLNLGNPLENSYIRVDIALEYRGGTAQREEIERRMPQLRDAIVGVIGRKSREFLLGPDGTAQLRRELQIRINRYMSQPIEAVYITDLLIE